MKKQWLASVSVAVTLIFALPPLGPGQEAKSQIGLSFWAFKGDGFVDNLQPDDLHLTVNGHDQGIADLCLIAGKTIARRDGQKSIMLPLHHDYFLLFQVYEFDPRMESVLNYFVKEILHPDDALIVITPFNTFRVMPADLKKTDRKKIADDLQKKFVKDIKIGSSIYRSLIRQLQAMALNIVRSGTDYSAQVDQSNIDQDSSESDQGIQVNLLRYKETLPQLEKLRLAEQERMVALAQQLKNPQRRQTVFFIYQKEYRPEIDPKLSSTIVSTYSDIPTVQADIAELFEFYKRESRFDTNRIRQVFADSGAQFHFIFVNQQVKQISGVYMREQSEDVLRTFADVAAATGGETVIGSNSDQVIRQLVDKYAAWYYLLFAPPDAATGEFQQIALKTGQAGVKIVCRRGYFK